MRPMNAVTALSGWSARRWWTAVGAAVVIAFAIGFNATMAGLIIGSLIVSFALLAPSIVLGYAVKAAERDAVWLDRPIQLPAARATAREVLDHVARVAGVAWEIRGSAIVILEPTLTTS